MRSDQANCSNGTGKPEFHCLLFTWTDHSEDVLYHRIILIPAACDWLEFSHVKNALDNAIISQVNACHLSKDQEIVLAAEHDDLGHAAF
jgi:hypothetical protein